MVGYEIVFLWESDLVEAIPTTNHNVPGRHTGSWGGGHHMHTHDDVKADGRAPGLYEGDGLRVAVLGHEELLPLAVLEPVAPFFSRRGRRRKTQQTK